MAPSQRQRLGKELGLPFSRAASPEPGLLSRTGTAPEPWALGTLGSVVNANATGEKMYFDTYFKPLPISG